MVGAMAEGAEVRETELSEDFVGSDDDSALSAIPESEHCV
jgi:hypothetical protein